VDGVTTLLLYVALFGFVLVLGGLVMDWLDPYDERRDARNRNR
jgi:hypothetical protein